LDIFVEKATANQDGVSAAVSFEAVRIWGGKDME
jgi:hypothetical protein